MEEITTRFEIVRLAVKMADHETIGVQTSKLRDLSLDDDLTEIIALLESRNYRQGLFLMKGYVNLLDDSFFDDTPSTPAPRKDKSEEMSQEAQNLFDMMQPAAPKTINLDDMLRMTEESAVETITYDESELALETYVTQAKEEVQKNKAYLDLHKNNVENKTVKPFEETESEALAEIGDLDEAETAVFYGPLEEQAESSDPDESSKDPSEVILTNEVDQQLSFPEKKFIDIDTDEVSMVHADQTSTTEEEQSESPDDSKETEMMSTGEALEVLPEDAPPATVEEEAEETRSKARSRADSSKDNRHYPPISYIDQKFRNMCHQFPQIEESESGIADEVKIFLKRVSTKGYTDNDIQDAIVFFQQKKVEGHLAEAAQMLLLAAASESKYAQLLLARELFKGEVLEADYPESFTQINRLAEHDYPEAICDLAQLYEYGYGIKKDKKTALLLYEEAVEMGVERASKHVERLSAGKGILGSLFRK